MSWARPSPPFATGGGLATAEPPRPGRAATPDSAGAGNTGAGSAGPPSPHRNRWIAAALLAVLLAGVVALVTYLLVRTPSSPAKAAAAPTTTTRAPAAAAVYQRILPSLVVVETTTPAGAELGSGVVVNRNGQVVTALHVVRDATAIRLTFADGTTTAATVSGTTPESDLATLAPAQPPSVIVPAVLAARQPRIGDTVYAVGNPLGLTASFTAGVVSGLDRTVPLADGSGAMQHVIQFDAAVDPGSSGGPLLDDRGEIVGYVTGLANPTDQGLFVGVGFATGFPGGAGGGGVAG